MSPLLFILVIGFSALITMCGQCYQALRDVKRKLWEMTEYQNQLARLTSEDMKLHIWVVNQMRDARDQTPITS